MTFVVRLEEVKKRLGFAFEIKSLRPEDWEAVLVSVIRDCQRDGAEAARERAFKACAKIADDFRVEASGAACGADFYKTACAVIRDRILAELAKVPE